MSSESLDALGALGVHYDCHDLKKLLNGEQAKARSRAWVKVQGVLSSREPPIALKERTILRSEL